MYSRNRIDSEISQRNSEHLLKREGQGPVRCFRSVALRFFESQVSACVFHQVNVILRVFAESAQFTVLERRQEEDDGHQHHPHVHQPHLHKDKDIYGTLFGR